MINRHGVKEEQLYEECRNIKVNNNTIHNWFLFFSIQMSTQTRRGDNEAKNRHTRRERERERARNIQLIVLRIQIW